MKKPKIVEKSPIPEGITKKEWSDLCKRGYKSFHKKGVEDLQIDEVILIVHNPSKQHDAGYPYIRAFGVKSKVLYELGWHDHTLIKSQVSIDSLGKNIFRLFSWDRCKWVMKPWFVSTLELTEEGEWK